MVKSHFKKTYKWAMETRGPKSNSSKLLYLSWLPATLMMFQSKNEWASMETPFSNYKSMGNFLDLNQAVNSVVCGPIWLKFKPVQDFMHVLVICKLKRIGPKTTQKRWRHYFPHYKSMGAFCCHGNQFWSNLPKNLMQPFPHPNDATHKIW